MIRASQVLSAHGQSNILNYPTPESNEKAIETLPKFDSGSYFVHSDGDNSTGVRIGLHDFGWFFPDDFLHEYPNFLFQSNQFLPFVIWSYYTDIFSPREWKRCALHAANKGCIDAHIFLAEYYSSSDHRNDREMKRHQRIAVDAKHSQA